MSVHIAACPQLCMLFIEIGHMCSAGLVWLFAGLADALALTGTLHNFFAMTWLLHSHTVLKPVIQESHLSMPSSHRVSCDRTYRILSINWHTDKQRQDIHSATHTFTENIEVIVHEDGHGNGTRERDTRRRTYCNLCIWIICRRKFVLVWNEDNIYSSPHGHHITYIWNCQ